LKQQVLIKGLKLAASHRNPEVNHYFISQASQTMKIHSSLLALVVFWWMVHDIPTTVANELFFDGDGMHFVNGGIIVTADVVELAKYGSIAITNNHITTHITQFVNVSPGESAGNGLASMLSMMAAAANINPFHIAAASTVSVSASVAVRYSARAELRSVEGSQAKVQLNSGSTELYLELKSRGSSPHYQGIPDTNIEKAQAEMEKLIPEGDNITCFEVYKFPLEPIPILNETHGVRLPGFNHQMIILTTTSGEYVSLEKWDDRISFRRSYSKKDLIATTEKDCPRFEAENRGKPIDTSNAMQLNLPPNHVLSYVRDEIPKGYNPFVSNCQGFVKELVQMIRMCQRLYNGDSRSSLRVSCPKLMNNVTIVASMFVMRTHIYPNN
jgi:hypothetical protein